MIQFKRQVAIALTVCAVVLSTAPSSAEPLTTHPTRTPPRDPPDNGPTDVGGVSGGPGLNARGDNFEFSTREPQVLDILWNDEYPRGTTVSHGGAGYAYLSWIQCPHRQEICLYYEPVVGDRPYPDKIPYTLSGPQGGRSNNFAYVTMP